MYLNFFSLAHFARSCTFLAWVQNTFNFSEADKKVKEVSKQNEWHDENKKNRIEMNFVSFLRVNAKNLPNFNFSSEETRESLKPNEDVH